MEFLDEEAKPRFLFQSRAQPSPLSDPPTQALNKPSLFICISTSSLLFAFAIFFLNSEPLQALLFWFALSLLLGPFAPSSLTGGDIRVGRGSVFEFQAQNQDPDVKNPKLSSSGRRHNNKPRRSEELGPISTSAAVGDINESAKVVEKKKSGVLEHRGNVSDVEEEEEEREWSEEDFELLKKQMVKHPVGKPKRWEVIAEAFRGRHGVESVVKMGKSMADRRMGGEDSFARFLKDRKPLDKRVEGVSEEGLGGGGLINNGEIRKEGDGGSELGWNSGEDIALLNALKAFPKDVPMRWEKIAAAVPGKSKNACMKRVAELKKGFRSSKAASEA